MKVRSNRNDQQCGNCKFANLLPGSPDLICQRMPPLPILYGMVQSVIGGPPQPRVVGHWPLVGADNWCGEWQQGTPISASVVPDPKILKAAN